MKEDESKRAHDHPSGSTSSEDSAPKNTLQALPLQVEQIGANLYRDMRVHTREASEKAVVKRAWVVPFIFLLCPKLLDEFAFIWEHLEEVHRALARHFFYFIALPRPPWQRVSFLPLMQVAGYPR